jgi:hypothetical protein
MSPARSGLLSAALLIVSASGYPVVQAGDPERASSSDAEHGQNEELSAEEILTESTDIDSYGSAPRCINTQRIRSVDVLDSQHVAFRISRDYYYLVQFQHRCPMLERNRPISYETRSMQLCRLDSIRGTAGAGSSVRPGPPCQIPGFREISREQLLLLKEQLKEDRRREPLLDDPDGSRPDEGSADTPTETG